MTREDSVTGKISQIISNNLETKLRQDLKRLKKICVHRGLRHYCGVRVRRQHTITTGNRVILMEKKQTMEKMDYLMHQAKVLEWAQTADSYDKLGFLKLLATTLGKIEIHNAKNILGHALKSLKRRENRKREWVGLPDEECAKKFRAIRNRSENPSTFHPSELSVLSRPLVSRRTDLPEAWWGKFSDFLGFDAEFVHLKEVTSYQQIRAGKVAVVDWTLDCIYSKDVYHAPGSFKDNYIMQRVSGIGSNDLIHGVPMYIVNWKLDQLFQPDETLVIVVASPNDFASVDLIESEYHVFDLQSYYKRPAQNPWELPTGMSLRDIYFLEFGEDFQGNRTHSAEKDARATVKIFVDGYVERRKKSKDRNDRYACEVFSDAVKLRQKDAKGEFFCNSEKKFKDWNVAKCMCQSCSQLYFYNKRKAK